MITMDEVERRLIALDSAQTLNAATMKWMVGTLGQIQATVDSHTEVLAEHTDRFDQVEKRFGAVKGEVCGLA